MTLTTRTRFLGLGSVTAAAALVLAGCASAPETEAGASGTAAGDFLPCAVSDLTGFKDGQFNELTYDGVAQAADELGVDTRTAESTSEDQYAGNISAMVNEDCSLIVTVGFALAAATRDSAAENPDIDYALIDSAVSDDDGTPVEVDNVKPVLFDTAQAAYLAGYLSAAASKTGVVGTYGGMPFPSVTVFMDGFVDGVAKFNEAHGAAVKVVGWDKAAQDGLFVGNFDDQVQAKTLSEGLLDQNVDVIMPVAGSLFLASIEAMKDRGVDGAILGVNNDAYEAEPEGAPYYLTSVLKNLTTAASEVTTAAGAGDFDSTPYVGTLENDGVGIAPLHDWESRIDPSVIAELDQLKADIIAGTVVVESPSSPSQG
ncbi:BMP family lipoprotein [Herbiconiux flava]|uniref:Basic membrane protein A n=1 Tax=Herbiconiux flava TaxID=881268 RepID=A0A852S9S6_9MICO|nr:BMP family ABC transporter substrate-binding protein [Herbiconiux flava]NYD69968.1 basic membrane protein A [Herbiconiux flava]GLK16717.1 BMP family ABC transporter substrate-binding protein [Herbiconiux flava]